jgi:hypothetical protein
VVGGNQYPQNDIHLLAPRRLRSAMLMEKREFIRICAANVNFVPRDPLISVSEEAATSGGP